MVYCFGCLKSLDDKAWRSWPQCTKWYLFCPKYASWIAFLSIGIYGHKKCTALLERGLALSLLLTVKIAFDAIYERKSKLFQFVLFGIWIKELLVRFQQKKLQENRWWTWMFKFDNLWHKLFGNINNPNLN
jgi:hypothetical protein